MFFVYIDETALLSQLWVASPNRPTNGGPPVPIGSRFLACDHRGGTPPFRFPCDGTCIGTTTMSNFPRVVIHVGVGKTGTTALQEDLFARHPLIHCAGRPHHCSQDYASFHAAATECEDIAAANDKIAAFVGRIYEQADDKSAELIVISDETLCTAPLNCVVAERLAAAMPQAEILITIRNQLTAIVSRYTGGAHQLKYVPKPYNGKPVPFDDWLDHCLANQRRTVIWAMRYDILYDVYRHRFERVHVLPIEAPDFHNRLSAILGVDYDADALASAKRNEGRPAGDVAYDALRSRLAPGVALSKVIPFGRQLRDFTKRRLQKSRTIELAPTRAEELRTVYSNGNARLSHMAGIDLGSLGYPV